tara:strand:+ start:3453 stop:3830 length:378 start_codon:yes stop_codon:yes gene_type:complete
LDIAVLSSLQGVPKDSQTEEHKLEDGLVDDVLGAALGEVLGDALGDVLDDVLGVVLGVVLGEALGDVLDDELGKLDEEIAHQLQPSIGMNICLDGGVTSQGGAIGGSWGHKESSQSNGVPVSTPM